MHLLIALVGMYVYHNKPSLKLINFLKVKEIISLKYCLGKNAYSQHTTSKIMKKYWLCVTDLAARIWRRIDFKAYICKGSSFFEILSIHYTFKSSVKYTGYTNARPSIFFEKFILNMTIPPNQFLFSMYYQFLRTD